MSQESRLCLNCSTPMGAWQVKLPFGCVPDFREIGTNLGGYASVPPHFLGRTLPPK